MFLPGCGALPASTPGLSSVPERHLDGGPRAPRGAARRPSARLRHNLRGRRAGSQRAASAGRRAARSGVPPGRGGAERAWAAPTPPPARSRAAAGRRPTLRGPALRHPPPRGSEAPASHPARVSLPLLALVLDAASAAGLRGSRPPRRSAQSARSHSGWAPSRPHRPGRRPRPGKVLFLLVPVPTPHGRARPRHRPGTVQRGTAPSGVRRRGQNLAQDLGRRKGAAPGGRLPAPLSSSRGPLAKAPSPLPCLPSDRPHGEGPGLYTKVDSSQPPVRESLIKESKWHLTQRNHRIVSCHRAQ